MRVVLAGLYPEVRGQVCGGVEAVVQMLASEYVRRGDIDAHVVSVRRDAGADETRDEQGVNVHLLSRANRLPYTLRVMGADLRKLRRTLPALEPTIVHAQGIDAPAVAALREGMPTVLTVHGIGHRDVLASARSPWAFVRLVQVLRLEWECLKRARFVIAISPYVLRVFGGRIRGKVALIENPVEEAFFRVGPLSRNGTILFIGAIGHRKSPRDIVRAAATLAREFPEMRVRIAGPEVDRGYVAGLWRSARAFGIENRVSVLGPIGPEAVLQEIQESHVVCLPSKQETAPIVVQQAMAAGRPVVATRIAGIPQQVADGRTGLLVEVNDIAALSQALGRLLRRPEESREMGEAGRREARSRFQLSAIADRTLAFYDEVLRTLR